MTINLPYKVRAVLYVVVVLGTAIIVPLEAGGVLDTLVLTVWASLSGAVSLLAAFNTVPTHGEEA